jgi:hypothetical protein
MNNQLVAGVEGLAEPSVNPLTSVTGGSLRSTPATRQMPSAN